MIRGLVLAIILSLGTSATAETVELTPEEARNVSIAAINQGDIATAQTLSDALLFRNSNDVTALIVRGRVAIAAGEFELARRLSSRAYDVSENADIRFTAARLVALSHANQEQFTRSQMWLRRARQVAPDDEARIIAATDFQAVQAQNPLSISLDFGIVPSNNVNNGSSNETVTAPDWANFLRSFLGSAAITSDKVDLSASSKSLAGYNIQGGMHLGYDVRRTETSRTTLTFGATFNQVVFTPQVERDNPTINPNSYSYQTLKFGFDHAWAAATGFFSFAPEVSQMWYGGSVYQKGLRLSASRYLPINERNALTFTPHYALTAYEGSGDKTHDVGVSVNWQHALENRGHLSVNFDASKISATDPKKASVGGGLSASYAHPEQVLGMQLSGSVGQSWRRFDGWNGGPGTRSDATTRVGLNAAFPAVEIYGFQPVVSLNASITQSDRDLYDKNVSGFGLNFRSAF